MKMRKVITLPSPNGGWNTVSSIADLKPLSRGSNELQANQAVVLDNFIPGVSSVVSRNGYSAYATGVGTGNVDALFELEANSVSKFIAAGSGKIYDISSAGAAVQIATGFASNQWIGTVFNGQLGIVNGVDAPQVYNGTTIGAMTISGVTATSIKFIFTFKNRTYFILNNSQSFWYSALNTLGGTLTEFPLGKVGNFGGNLAAIATLTRDGGSGQGDAICFFMTTGEIIVYDGTDPGSNFNLTGIFRTGRPLNSRAIIKFGPDVFFVDNQGYHLMSDLLPLSFGKSNSGVNKYIKGAAAQASKVFPDPFGWQAILSPSNNFLLVNVPQGATYVQHVMDVNTLAWCRFTNIPSRCWALYGGSLYFGDMSGNVFSYGTVYTDNGAAITSVYQSGYIKFSESVIRGAAFRPNIQFDSTLTLGIKSSVDFKPFSTQYTKSYGSSGAFWGDPWGTQWSSFNAAFNYLNLSKVGYSTSISLTFTSPTQVRFYETNYLIESGKRI